MVSLQPPRDLLLYHGQRPGRQQPYLEGPYQRHPDVALLCHGHTRRRRDAGPAPAADLGGARSSAHWPPSPIAARRARLRVAVTRLWGWWRTLARRSIRSRTSSWPWSSISSSSPRCCSYSARSLQLRAAAGSKGRQCRVDLRRRDRGLVRQVADVLGRAQPGRCRTQSIT